MVDIEVGRGRLSRSRPLIISRSFLTLWRLGRGRRGNILYMRDANLSIPGLLGSRCRTNVSVAVVSIRTKHLSHQQRELWNSQSAMEAKHDGVITRETVYRPVYDLFFQSRLENGENECLSTDRNTVYKKPPISPPFPGSGSSPCPPPHFYVCAVGGREPRAARLPARRTEYQSGKRATTNRRRPWTACERPQAP